MALQPRGVQPRGPGLRGLQPRGVQPRGSDGDGDEPDEGGGFDPTTALEPDFSWWADSLDLADEASIPVWAADVGGTELTNAGPATYYATAGPGGRPLVLESLEYIFDPSFEVICARTGTGDVTLSVPFSIVAVTTGSAHVLIKDGNFPLMQDGFSVLTDNEEPGPLEGVELNNGESWVVHPLDPPVTDVLIACVYNGASSKVWVNGVTETGTLPALGYLDPLLVAGPFSLLNIHLGVDITADPGWAGFVTDAAAHYDLTIA